MVAFKDHLEGRVKIAFVCTVSCNNQERAQIVQWLAWEMNITDISIIASSREEARWRDKKFDMCIKGWQWKLNGDVFEKRIEKTAFEMVELEDLCQMKED